MAQLRVVELEQEVLDACAPSSTPSPPPGTPPSTCAGTPERRAVARCDLAHADPAKALGGSALPGCGRMAGCDPRGEPVRARPGGAGRARRGAARRAGRSARRTPTTAVDVRPAHRAAARARARGPGLGRRPARTTCWSRSPTTGCGRGENVVVRDEDGADPGLGERPRPGQRPDAVRARRRARAPRAASAAPAPTCWSSGRSARPGRSAPTAGSPCSRSTPAPSPTTSGSTAGWQAPGFTRVRTWWQMKPSGHHRTRRRWSTTRRTGSGDGVVVRLVEHRATASRTRRPARGARRARGGVHRPLQLQARRPSTSSCSASARTPATAGTTGGWPSVDGQPAAGRRLVGSLEGPAPTAPTSPTSASLEAARGRGVAKGLLRTVIADAAARGRDRVGLEVDADSPTGADRALHGSMGWETTYVTESWHRDVPVDADRRVRR